jgi:hypothetical protein
LKKTLEACPASLRRFSIDKPAGRLKNGAQGIHDVKAREMTQETESPRRAPDARKTRAASPLLVFLLLFVIYNVNFRLVRTADTAPARVMPFCLLVNHTIYLDRWIDPIIASSNKLNGTYYLAKSRGHWMSAYPIIMPLAITPLYAVPAWLVARQNPPLSPGDIILSTLVDTMEKLCASLIAALSAVVLYLAVRKIAPARLSLLITLVYGLASSTWSISSQGLWRHGFTQLCFAGLLWGLFRGNSGRACWCGLALAGAAANNISDVIVVLPFLIYFAGQGRREFARFFAPLSILGSLVLAYNLYFFGRVLGGYPSLVQQTPEGLTLFKAAPYGEAAAGLLISPSRGLLIYVPWVVCALWGMARAWKESTLPGGRYLIAGMIGVYVEHSALGTWWGGWCYGPRYLSDLLPFLALFLVPVWAHIRSRKLLRAAVVAAFIVAVWIQIIGAFNYPGGNWDGFPGAIDQHPQRLWDWKDNQIRRTWKAGPARPDLFYDLFLLGDLVKRQRPEPQQTGRKGQRAGRNGAVTFNTLADVVRGIRKGLRRQSSTLAWLEKDCAWSRRSNGNGALMPLARLRQVSR